MPFTTPAVLFLAASTLTATTLAQPPAPSPTKPPVDPGIKAAPAPGKPSEADPNHPSDIFASRTPIVVAEGYRFVEGPTWVPGAPSAGGNGAQPGYLIFCEYPSATVYKLQPSAKPGEAKAALFREDSGGAIGSAVDAQGRFYFCEAKERRITRLTLGSDGTWSKPEVLCAEWKGERLNDTNDMTVAPTGDVYFTDPTFFNRGQWKQAHKGLYRIAPTGEVTLADATLKLPNGVTLSPDAATLYVNEFGDQKVIAYDVAKDGALSNKRELADLKSFGKGTRGGADGLKCDTQGRIFTTGPGGVYVLSSKGELIDFLSAPGLSNVCIGGGDGKSLYMTSGGKVLVVPLK